MFVSSDVVKNDEKSSYLLWEVLCAVCDATMADYNGRGERDKMRQSSRVESTFCLLDSSSSSSVGPQFVAAKITVILLCHLSSSLLSPSFAQALLGSKD
jgi:hypothetical protein